MKHVLISVEQAADMLGIGRTLAWDLVNKGKIKSVKIGARRLVPVSALDEYVASLSGGDGDAA